MKKKILIGVASLIAVLAIVLVVLCLNKTNYHIEVSMVDDYSPDLILTVYNDKNEKIEVKRIEYTDGTLLCNGYNTTVHFGDIKDETKLKIVLKDNKKATAKIVEKEVK